jgi:hypothetical protein
MLGVTLYSAARLTVHAAVGESGGACANAGSAAKRKSTKILNPRSGCMLIPPKSEVEAYTTARLWRQPKKHTS